MSANDAGNKQKKRGKRRRRTDPTKKWVLGGEREREKERVVGKCGRVEKRFLRDAAIGEEMGGYSVLLCMERTLGSDGSVRLKAEWRLKVVGILVSGLIINILSACFFF